jgi:hypothetical protein
VELEQAAQAARDEASHLATLSHELSTKLGNTEDALKVGGLAGGGLVTTTVIVRMNAIGVMGTILTILRRRTWYQLHHQNPVFTAKAAAARCPAGAAEVTL